MKTQEIIPPSSILQSIEKAPIFAALGLFEQKMLADKSFVATSAPDEILIEQGDIGDRLYIIMEGQVNVSVRDVRVGWRRVNVLGPGDVVGEIAVIRRMPRTARVTTLTKCKYLTINAHDFMDVYQYFSPKARDNIQLVVAKRLRELGLLKS